MNTLTDGWDDGYFGYRADATPKIILGAPNPFHGSARIAFTLPGDTFVSLDVYDVSGRQVRRLLNGQRAAGINTVTWDATNDLGQRVVPGVYFYRLQTDRQKNVQRVVLLP
jgi:hypothetical protein